MYTHLRPLLFRLPPETAHALTIQLLRLGGWPVFTPLLGALFAEPGNPVQAFGLTFKNPLGLAAGYDKDGLAVSGLAALGFGHVEVGTVTLRPQAGNPLPRVFRLPEDSAVINRMGFPGRGAEFVARQLRNNKQKTILGVNLGKNKDTPLEQAAQDYIALIRLFTPLADYLTINISSPNTVGLRRLQGREMLESLLGEIARERNQITLGHSGRIPVLVKIAPDLSDDELEDAVGIILQTGMDGIIATNTTLQREGLQNRNQGESGGLSGQPLRALADSVLAKVVARVNGKIPVIGVGGIMTPDDAKKKIDLGATLVQVYTGLVYAGPGLIRQVIRRL